MDYSNLASQLGGQPLTGGTATAALKSNNVQQPGQNYGAMAQQLGGTPMGGTSSPEVANGAQLADTGSFGGNLLNSAGNFFGGIGHAIAHPIDTAAGIGKIALGGVEKLVPGRQGAEDQFDALTNFYKQRYGTVDNFLTTLKQDPVGVAADASLVFGGAAGALGKLGKISEIDSLSQAGNIAGKVGELANPISAATKPLGVVGDVLANKTKGILGDAAQNLELENFKLTPVQKANLSKVKVIGDDGVKVSALQQVAQDALNWLKPGDNENRFSQTETLVSDFGKTMGNLIKEDAGEVTVPKTWITNQLDALRGTFKNDIANRSSNNNLISSVIDGLEKDHPNNIPLSDLLEQQQSFNSKAFKANNLNINNQVAEQIRKVFGNSIEDALDNAQFSKNIPLKVPEELKQFFPGKTEISFKDLKSKYSRVLRLRDLAEKASGRQELGLVGKLAAKGAGAIIGHAVGGIPGELAGTMFGENVGKIVAGSKARGYMARGAQALNNVQIPSVPASINLNPNVLSALQRLQQSASSSTPQQGQEETPQSQSPYNNPFQQNNILSS